MLGLASPPTGTVLENFPHTVKTGALDFYKTAFYFGKTERFQLNYQDDGQDNFFHRAAKRKGEVLMVSFTDTANQDCSLVETQLR